MTIPPSRAVAMLKNVYEAKPPLFGSNADRADTKESPFRSKACVQQEQSIDSRRGFISDT